MNSIALQDALGFLVFALILGSFSFWLVGYFLYEMIAFALRGPSPQMRSVGTSILDEEQYLPVPAQMAPPAAVAEQPPAKRAA